MTVETVLNSWLGIVGGITGLGFLVYMGLMIYYQHRKEKELAAIRLQLAELRGLILGRK